MCSWSSSPGQSYLNISVTWLLIMYYLFVAGLYKTEDKSSVHNRQQIIKKEGKACIQSLNHFCVLGNRT